MSALRTVAKPFVVVATIICYLSMGGAMLVAVWPLVPLHWWASRDSGPIGTGGWALLAGMSVAEAAWMYAYIATDHAAVSLAVAPVALVGTIAVFLRAAANRRTSVPLLASSVGG